LKTNSTPLRFRFDVRFSVFPPFLLLELLVYFSPIPTKAEFYRHCPPESGAKADSLVCQKARSFFFLTRVQQEKLPPYSLAPRCLRSTIPRESFFWTGPSLNFQIVSGVHYRVPVVRSCPASRHCCPSPRIRCECF